MLHRAIIPENFEIQKGVCQGYILSLIFFCRSVCFGSIDDIIFPQKLWLGWSHPLTLSQGPGSNDLRFGEGGRRSYTNGGKQIKILEWESFSSLLFMLEKLATKEHSCIREFWFRFSEVGKGLYHWVYTCFWPPRPAAKRWYNRKRGKYASLGVTLKQSKARQCDGQFGDGSSTTL